MAAVEVSQCWEDRQRSGYGLHATQHWTIGWDEEDTRIRLKAIAQAWIASRTLRAQNAYIAKLDILPELAPTWLCRFDKPLRISVPEPERSPNSSLPSELDDEVTHLHDPAALARRESPTSNDLPRTSSNERRRSSDSSLFHDPTMTPPIDFQSDDGFIQFAKKKKKNQASSGWDDTPEEKKEEGGDSNGGDKGAGDTGGAGGGDAAGGAGDGDDKKDEGKGNDEPPADDWDTFAPAKSKKKGKKGKSAVEEPPAAPEPPPEEKFDAFHEIKLDDTAPMLDLSFDAPTAKSSTAGGLGSWGSSWGNTTTK
ncbi:hypothetical protein BGZ60DRAFT_265403 [Tricladium varicosporioides]|nr:hypothetical protein BGZ60DRAFT_265403 [Hymenoscyphus varicosporioides]